MLTPRIAFMLMDALRRQAGSASDLWGTAPVETPWREVASFPGVRLRAYHPADHTGPILLILPAPFKRAYIWDLLPEVSVVRAALQRGARVYLLEWLAPGAAEREFGLEQYALHLPEQAIEAITGETGERQIVLMGHSIGGTYAAIFASLRPDRVSRLGLIDAPLAFGNAGGPIAQAIARAPHARHVTELVGSPVAGSAIDLFSIGAAPDAMLVQRWTDLLASLASPDALSVHLRVLRWSLDELPMPGRLFKDLVEELYRNDRFRSGTLRFGRESARLDRLQTPIVAVINPAGRVVPPESVMKGLSTAPSSSQQILRYEPDPGPALQHLGPLVSPRAHRELWPRIFSRLAVD